MIKIISVPRINALGLKGPEKAPESILENIDYEKIIIKNDNIKEDENLILKKSKAYFNNDSKPLFIGGDHSITYPLVKNFFKQYKSKSFLIIFDAHPDCMPAMKEPTHEDFLAGLVRSKFPCKNICLIGVRKKEPEEELFLKKNKIRYFSSDIDYNEIKKYLIKKTKNKKVYLSIDVDVIDPKKFMAVNYPEKNGLSIHEFKKILKLIFRNCELEAADIVEYVPEKDIKNKSKKIILKLIKLFDNCF